ncbi:MAG: methyltransferase domain-containing protein [Chloroflexi bacterium]|nr:methyltransferase domain-containing protein [Chloroflexota bacterium]
MAKDHYTHGHSEAVTRHMASRTATTNAAFFVPYLKPGMRLLDCGCGPGTITLGLARIVAPAEVIGIDFGASQIERARAQIGEQHVTNARFEVADVYQMPFPQASFDAVFCHTLLEHLAEPQKALREMHRVLKPGGVIGVREGDRGAGIMWPADSPVSRFLSLLIDVVKANGGDPFVGRKLRSLLNAAGFVSVQGSASSNSHGTTESIRDWAKTGRAYAVGTLATRARELGLASQSEVESMAAGFDDLADNPDAFLAGLSCEAVGWKE